MADEPEFGAPTGTPLIVARDDARHASMTTPDESSVRPTTPVVSFDVRIPRDLPLTRASTMGLLREQTQSLDTAVGHLLDGLKTGRPTDGMVIEAATEVDELCHLLKDTERSK